jgi:hypothetical protein
MNAGNGDDKVSSFEKEYAATLSTDERGIKLIGCKTFEIKPEDRDEFKKNMEAHMDEINKGKNIYFAEDYSYYRMYFALHTAVVDYNGIQYTADEKGVVLIPESDEIGKIKVVGRKKSETVRGTPNDIITDDKIHFKAELKQEVKDGVKSGYSYQKEKICVFVMSGWSM